MHTITTQASKFIFTNFIIKNILENEETITKYSYYNLKYFELVFFVIHFNHTKALKINLLVLFADIKF